LRSYRDRPEDREPSPDGAGTGRSYFQLYATRRRQRDVRVARTSCGGRF
jgi:hypothetical protein